MKSKTEQLVLSSEGGSDMPSDLADPKIRKLIFSLRQKVQDQEQEIKEQQQLMEHFILDTAPAKATSIESKCLVQNLKMKIKNLEKDLENTAKNKLKQ